jgi:5-methylcytosine-specific restriction protein A
VPSRALRPCKDRDCIALTNDKTGYCPEHTYLVKELNKQKEKLRKSARERGYDSTWEKLRKIFLRENPLCQDCLDAGKLTPANEVHHIKKVKEHPELRLVKTNLRALCKACHNRRTANGE